MNKTYCVYIHTNTINNKKYIGQTSQKPEKRWNNGEGYKTSIKFYNAIQKYGWESFTHEIIAINLSLEEANFLEASLIQRFNTQDDKFGYNVKNGGNNGHHSEETKKKIGLSNKVSQKGKTCSQEQKELISRLFSGEGNPFYGHHHTEETKKIISDKMKGRFSGAAHPFYGHHHTEESTKKISQNRKSKGGKKVICVNTGEVFNTMMDAARWCGLKNATSIGQICNNKGKQKTAGKHPITGEKLKWRFIE